MTINTPVKLIAAPAPPRNFFFGQLKFRTIEELDREEITPVCGAINLMLSLSACSPLRRIKQLL